MEIRALKLIRIPLLFLIISFVAIPLQTFSKPTKTTPVTSAMKGIAPSQGSVTQPATQGGLRSDAQAAVLMDAHSGQVLYEQNPNLKISPASFNKILTL